MSSATDPKPLDCPHSKRRAMLIVGMGNYWVCCHKSGCECTTHCGIAKRKNYAVREWNRYVEKMATLPTPRASGQA